MHGAPRRRGGVQLPRAGGRLRRSRRHHHRGPRRGRQAPPAAGGVHRRRCLPVRVLYAGAAHGARRPLRARRAALGRANHARSERQSLPLRRLPAHLARGAHGPRPMITRLEGADKVTGRARYAADVRLPGLLHAHIVRSPYPHARIRHIDASRAERLPGVHAVLSSANSPSIPWHDASSLFDRTVRYIGDEVAAVAADSDELAADAARLIDVQYEALAFDLVGEAREPKAEARGDVARGLREADVVLEATYRTQTALHNALEPHGCTALWHGDQLTVYESTQGIFAVRDEVAEKLGLAAQNVRIITEHMGGGFGAKQIAWKHTVIAARLGIDALELRLRNYATRDQREDKPYTAPESLRRCITRVAAACEWRHQRPGLGFAAHDWAAGGGWPPAEAEVAFAHGAARVIVGVQDVGTGSRTALAQLAAAELGIGVERVQVELGDTQPGLYGPTSAGSATLATLGPVVQEAARLAKKSGHARAQRGENPKGKSIRTCGAQAVELAVDRDTGEVTVKRVIAAHDCGRIVNPLLQSSQVIGGITQALGYALSEKRIVDARLGDVLNANLEEYKLPTVADIPEIVNASESMPDAEANATGVKGCGEPPIISTAAAIANAIYSATGVRIRELPITREKLIR